MDSDYLISDLSAHKEGIYQRFHEYLSVFQDSESIVTKKQKEFLINTYGQFLFKAVKFLSKHLSYPTQENEHFAIEGFNVFSLCLSCLGVISRFVKKPSIILNSRYNILSCYINWHRWEAGELEGMEILKELEPMKSNGKLLAGTISMLFTCVLKKRTRRYEDYQNLYDIALRFEEHTRILDYGTCKLVLKDLVTCTISLLEEFHQSDLISDIASNFCDLIINTSKSIRDSPHLTCLSDSLHRISVNMSGNGNFRQAVKTLELHSLVTCKIIEGNRREEECGDFFVKWCDGSCSLIQVLIQFEVTSVKGKVLERIEMWDKRFSSYLPCPIPLIEQWVQIQLENTNSFVDVAYLNASLLGTLIGHSSNISRKILLQELLFYMTMQVKNPDTCRIMQMKIMDLLNGSGFDRAIDWFEEAKRLKVCGFGRKYCMLYLSQVIEISSGLRLATAYCLRSLCKEECEPNSTQVFQDIHSALIVLNSPKFDGSVVPNSLIKILYCIFDLLSLKGCVDFHHDIYTAMQVIFNQRKMSLDNLLVTLWESRRTGHAFCPSPDLETFMSMSDVFGEKLHSTEFWRDCFKRSQPLVAGIHNNSLPALSSITLDNFEEAAGLIPTDSESGSYLAGYMYYDLCEKLLSSGRSVQALMYAIKAQRLREELYKQKFLSSFNGCDQEHKETENHMLVRRAVANELWSSDTISSDLDIFYISPWIALQRYLESILQVGVIHEILGNGAEAKYVLDHGKRLSCSHSLTMFNIVFSSCLGQLYQKKQHLDLAKKELHYAKDLLKDCMIDGFCSKCRVVLEVTIADLEKLSSKAYKEALLKLDASEWKKYIYCPEDVNSQSSNLECDSLKCKEKPPWDLALKLCITI